MYFTTSDLGLAAALRYKGYQIDKWEKQGKKFIFHFGDDDDIGEHARAYLTGTMIVNALAYSTELRNIKTRLSNNI